VRGDVHEVIRPGGTRDLPGPLPGVDDAHLFRIARRLAEATLELPPGAWDPRAAPAAARDAFATLLVDGLVLRELQLDGVATAQLHVPGETLDPFAQSDGLLCRDERVAWHAVEDSTVVVLGRRFLAATRQFPALMVGISRRQLEQSARAARHAAVAQLPRVDRRILALLCGLAEERGRVAVDGVTVDLPVTHEVLGQLVGARRPTVTLALKALAQEGRLCRRGTHWLIPHGASVLGRADPAPATMAA
jgi:CRP/FNR family transcriptional regulator, cyclic AMP receptor protein